MTKARKVEMALAGESVYRRTWSERIHVTLNITAYIIVWATVLSAAGAILYFAYDLFRQAPGVFAAIGIIALVVWAFKRVLEDY